MLFVSFVIVAASVAFKYMFLSVIYAFGSRSLTTISKLPMTFKDAFHLCFYAQTVAIILVSVNTATGYIVYPLFMSILGIIITIVIIHKAMGPHMPDLDDIIDRFYNDDDKSD